jgi:hypothetical protein
MRALKVAGTEFTPDISFDPEKGKLDISGVSRPENANEFYEPVIEWLNNYIKVPADETSVNIRFDYFNTSSLKYFLIILSSLKEISDNGKPLEIFWWYDAEDESMLEAGKNLEELSELEFSYLSNDNQ